MEVIFGRTEAEKKEIQLLIESKRISWSIQNHKSTLLVLIWINFVSCK